MPAALSATASPSSSLDPSANGFKSQLAQTATRELDAGASVFVPRKKEVKRFADALLRVDRMKRSEN